VVAVANALGLDLSTLSPGSAAGMRTPLLRRIDHQLEQLDARAQSLVLKLIELLAERHATGALELPVAAEPEAEYPRSRERPRRKTRRS
jgi:hypothetical protein